MAVTGSLEWLFDCSQLMKNVKANRMEKNEIVNRFMIMKFLPKIGSYFVLITRRESH
jgi:hypothetical protein